MATIVAPARWRGAPQAWLAGLLAAAIFINYVDRGNLATASPVMKGELGLTNGQIGLLVSAFFWTYAPAQLLAAWLVARINAYRALALGLFIWSVATMLSGLAQGFAALLALRVLLGVGESAGFPAAAKLLARHLPTHRLGSANALVSVGIALGPAFGTFIGGLLLAQVGWRALFVLFGAASLLWLIPWLLFARRDALELRPGADAPEPPYAELLSRRDLWGACLGHFACNYAFYLVLSWLPLYLVKAHGFTLVEMARLGGAVYAASAVIGLSAGFLADRLMAGGASATIVRKATIGSGMIVGLFAMLACAQGDARLAVAGLLIYAASHGLSSFNVYAIGQTLAGPAAAGKWIGFQNFAGNLAGIIAPWITGVLVDRTGDFRVAFLSAAAVLIAGLVGWCLMIGKVEPLRWRASVAG